MRKARSNGSVKLNITPMMDMFTIILVFLLKNFSTQGQLVTPATGLLLPASSIERSASEALTVKITQNSVFVEDAVVIDSTAYAKLLTQKEFLIPRLHSALTSFSQEARRSADLFGQRFSGQISIQGDVSVPYRVLTRIMYTCGQAEYPIMNLVVYRKE